MSEYKQCGAGWNRDNGSISIKLEGIELNATLWPNKYKKSENQPDWNISVKNEVAETLGLVRKDKEEIDPEDIPF